MSIKWYFCFVKMNKKDKQEKRFLFYKQLIQTTNFNQHSELWFQFSLVSKLLQWYSDLSHIFTTKSGTWVMYLVVSFQILCVLFRGRSTDIQLIDEFTDNSKGRVSWILPSLLLLQAYFSSLYLFFLVLKTKVGAQFNPICCILTAMSTMFETKKWEDRKG